MDAHDLTESGRKSSGVTPRFRVALHSVGPGGVVLVHETVLTIRFNLVPATITINNSFPIHTPRIHVNGSLRFTHVYPIMRIFFKHPKLSFGDIQNHTLTNLS